MSKMKDEFNSFSESAKNFKGVIDSNAPSWLVQGFDKIVNHPGTPYFFLGMGFEALGLSIQFYFQGVTYPIMDCIISFLIGYSIMYYIARKERAGRIKD